MGCVYTVCGGVESEMIGMFEAKIIATVFRLSTV